MAQQTLNELYEIIKNRKAQPKEGSYTNYLFDKGLDKILKKVGEEATEGCHRCKERRPSRVDLRNSRCVVSLARIISREKYSLRSH